MVLPALVLVLLFVVAPVFENVRAVFYDWSGIGRPDRFVGLANFRRIAGDALFWNAVRNTGVFVLLTVPAGLVSAFGLAIILNDPGLRGRTVLRTMIFVPVITSAAVVGIVVGMLLHPLSGPIPPLLRSLGIHTNLLADASTALPTVAAVTVWHGVGIPMLIALAALQTVPRALYDAAEVDGAGWWALHRNITLPSIAPTVVLIVLLMTIGALGAFDMVLTLTGGGPFFASEVVGTYIFRYAFGSGIDLRGAQIGYASAAASLVSLASLSLAVLVLMWRRRRPEAGQ